MTAHTTTVFEYRRRGGLEVLAWPAFDPFPVDVMVTTRQGGVSAGDSGQYATLNLGLHVGDDPQHVQENRRRTAEAIGTALGDFVFCRQSHGSQARVVSAPDRGRGTVTTDDAVADTDALVTADPGTVLAVLVADCVPLVLYDPRAHVLACVHAGWRGTVAKVAQSAVTAMCSLGSRPGDVVAGIGPAVSPAGYQVGEDVRDAVEETFGQDTHSVIRPDGSGRWLCDTWAANKLVLREAGLRDEHIHLAAVPTGAGEGRFFSHRETQPCGRFAAVAKLRPREGA
jgi:purine-nucleoside/S-methyl-5'-thioadenosine phosphorylase / adenosine deaminase